MLEGLFLRNHSKPARAVPTRHLVTVSRRFAADYHTNTNIILLHEVLVGPFQPASSAPNSK